LIFGDNLSTLLPLSFKHCNDDNKPMLSGSASKLQQFSKTNDVKVDCQALKLKQRFDALSFM
jgi:hypothetical protein